MKKLILFFLIFGYAFSQTNCELCVQQDGFYCGDDESNWTQYSPNGCVPNGANGLYYLNDGWEDCVDGSDEQNAVPTTIDECGQYGEQCDTVFVPVIEYVFDTIIEYETIIEYVNCETGLPWDISLQEVVDKSKNTGLIYDLSGKVMTKPEGVYIENGQIKYKL